MGELSRELSLLCFKCGLTWPFAWTISRVVEVDLEHVRAVLGKKHRDSFVSNWSDGDENRKREAEAQHKRFEEC